MPVVNFDQVKEFDLLPKGKYLCELETHDWRTAGSGNDQLRLQYRVVEGDFENRRLSAFCTFTAESAWFLKMNLVACGADPDSLKGDLNIEDENIEPLYDARVVVDVSIDTSYDPNGRNKIQKITSAEQYTYA